MPLEHKNRISSKKSSLVSMKGRLCFSFSFQGFKKRQIKQDHLTMGVGVAQLLERRNSHSMTRVRIPQGAQENTSLSESKMC